ncbi:MAG TPA: Rieske (2Fe-2S) protein [Thermomicrobiales bacterium]|nr:Rieske (2Fe-2S) protein [Thermomicrobiales bacterium]
MTGERIHVGRVDEIPHGGRIVDVRGMSIGLFRFGEEVSAVLNICPHELAPVCKGIQRGTSLPSAPGEYIWGREDEILACPWHQWEFDLRTGQSLTDPKVRVRTFPVEIEHGDVFIRLRSRG